MASSSRVELVIPANSKSRFTIEPRDGMEIVHVDGDELGTWDTRTGKLTPPGRELEGQF